MAGSSASSSACALSKGIWSPPSGMPTGTRSPWKGYLPRHVEASAIIHGASVALLQGDVVDAASRAERALTAMRLAPVQRVIVRCAGWVAVVSAMRGDLARARSLIAEAG